MVIVMPQELEVWYLLPAIRRDLAKEFLKLGLKQSEIARLLGISRAAITQYLTYKRANEVIFDNKTKLAIKKSAKLIHKNPNSLVLQMQLLCKIAKQNKVLCSINRCNCLKNNNCEVCLK